MSSFYSVPSSSFVNTHMDMQYNVPISAQTAPPISAPMADSLSVSNPPFMSIFGPLGKDYCIWFYFLSVIGFVLLVFLLVSGVYVGLTTKKGLDYYSLLIVSSFAYAIVYFQNRLLYGMCSR